MANYFSLELDTTGPDVALAAPHYTVPGIETEVMVRASEQLSTYQEFYFIHPDGSRTNMIFDHQGDSYRGLIRFNEDDLGIVTLYARVKDEVDNLSSVVSNAIHVKEGAPIEIVMHKQVRFLGIQPEVRSLSTERYSRNIVQAEYLRGIDADAASRKVVSDAHARRIEVETNDE